MVDDIFRRVVDAALGNDESSEQERRPRPASEDPYGDPADQSGQGYGDVIPASQDPYGDPADQSGQGYEDVRPASEDPYGDPADHEEGYRY